MNLPEQNFAQHIVNNTYPGRGLVIGRSSVDDSWLMVYWIMGRSAHSRNRKFVVENNTLRTEPVDPSLVEDPSLIIYEAMRELPNIYLVTNGDQTDTICEAIQAGRSFDDALATREREPDAPNYTPRISGMLDFTGGSPSITLSILKANLANPDYTDRTTFRPANPPAGIGICLTTYKGNGQPIPPFEGDPLLIACKGTPEAVLDTYWTGLDQDNRISVAVKQIDPKQQTRRVIIRNTYA